MIGVSKHLANSDLLVEDEMKVKIIVCHVTHDIVYEPEAQILVIGTLSGE